MDKSLKRFSTHLIDLMAHLEISEGIHSDVVFSEPGSGSLSLSLSRMRVRDPAWKPRESPYLIKKRVKLAEGRDKSRRAYYSTPSS